MKMMQRQRGMTSMGWLIVLALIGFFSLLTIKMAPVYLEHYSIKTVLKSLRDEPNITRKTTGEVRRLIMKRLDINGVYDLDSKAVRVKRDDGVMHVDITYEVRKPMMGNVDVVMAFSDQVELISN